MHTLFFDFGNVVGHFDHRIAVRRFVSDCDLNEDDCFAAIYDTALEDDFESGRVEADEFIRRSCNAIRYRGTPAQFRSAFQDIFRPNPDVCALIPRLAKQHRLVLASNTNELHTAQFRSTFADVLNHFSALGLSHEAGARKPHRRFFEHCQQLAECPPHECLFIDDLAANVEGARAFGWQAVQYTAGADLLKLLRSHGIAADSIEHLRETNP
jgi:putative hydrolase of the HAD superfamily